MAAKLKINTKEANGWLVSYLSGEINEASTKPLAKIKDAPNPNVIFDFFEVKGINSSGIAEWLKFIQDFAANRTVLYDRCPPFLVNVFNLVESFVSQVQVRSVLLPFDCINCNRAENLVFDMTTQRLEDITSSPPECTQCNNRLFEDFDSQDYFLFLDDSA